MDFVHSQENEGNEALTHQDVLAGQKADTRRKILRSARTVFLRDGFMEANLNEVATVAGVGKGTLYRHFPNKSELYVAMLSEHGAALAREMAGILDLQASVLEQIGQVARFYLEFWQRHPEHFQIIWAVQNRDLLAPLSPELTDHVREIFERPIRMLSGLIDRGIAAGEIRSIDPWNTANALALGANAIVGPIVTGAAQIVERDMSAVYRQFVDLALTSLAAPPAAPAAGRAA